MLATDCGKNNGNVTTFYIAPFPSYIKETNKLRKTIKK
jgi:hypothetical protein